MVATVQATPVAKKISEKCWRITGVTLAHDASFTIGFTDKAAPADVSILEPNWEPYALSDGSVVSLQDAVKVTFVDVAAAQVTSVDISIAKTGTTHGDFVATLTNTSPDLTSPELEIYVEWGGH